MIRPIQAETVARALGRLSGRKVYLHIEVTPGGFLRNVTADLEDAVLRCDGSSYRLALRCSDDGWVVMEGLTYMAIEEGQPLLLCTLEEEDRLTRVIQISEEAFAA